MTNASFALSDDPEAPLWRRAERAISAAIEAGRFGAGDRLPPEHRLAAELGAHRHTVRRAVESLVGRGLLEIRRGRGTYVASGPIPYRIGPRSRFTENMEKVGLRPDVRVLRSATTPADREAAQRLRLEVGAPIVGLDLLRSGDDVPIVLARHSFPADRFADFAERFAKTRSITQTFASYGVVGYTRKATRISARLPTSQEAQDLAASPTAPILAWTSVNVDTDGRPIDLDASAFAASRVDIIFDDESS
ncbi:phosphonate metabolism transcriptional regulator PhnF [Methylosinus sp. KRF6]|uniref:phosphonate metabolism transcriptional regulator PhnF n=1 Tax=Methylosinus sp. KRF6 TaxID=2846853 RepID=UPI001C0D4926|nr:phosphonate metabolism transcriptional regulator PhnF [Methylosinus sp. KRF6]MBU3889296.1 phosphonate metabolism transcriptional regulator PhnF [Methylosinus sp. KRF6]